MTDTSPLQMKRCSKCGEVKPCAAFSRNKSTRDGLQAYCQICRRDPKQAAINAKKAAAVEGVKWCSGCDEYKVLEAFSNRKDKRGNIVTRSQCRACDAAYYQSVKEDRYIKDKAKRERLKARETIIVPTEKRCYRCKRVLPSQCFANNRSSVDGLSAACRDCFSAIAPKYAEQRAAYRRNNRDVILERRRERYRDNPEPIRVANREYHQRNRDRSNAKRRAWHVNNLDRAKAASRAYRLANLEKLRAYSRRWREANAERIKRKKREEYLANRTLAYERVRQWVRRNPQKAKAFVRAWAQRNPDRLRMHKHNRRARIAGNGGRFTQRDIENMMAIQQGHCAYCGRVGLPLAVEHILSVFRGGSSDPYNLCLSCKSCNSSKGTKTIEEWLAAGPWYLR